MNKNEAIKATRNGAIAACISAAITSIVVIFSIVTDAEKELAYWNNPSFIIDIIFVLICAYGIYRKSRIASILMFLYFIASKIILAIDTQSHGGIVMSLIFLYFFGKAIQGSFVFQKLKKEENPAYKTNTKWTYIVATPLILIIVVALSLTLLTYTSVLPSLKVQSVNEISNTDINILIDNGIITKDEKVEYFYSQGFSSILESGNILTKNHVIFYITNENKQVDVYKLHINEIVDVKLESKGGLFSDSVYKVITKDPDRWLKLFLSPQNKGDQKFVNTIRKKLSEQ